MEEDVSTDAWSKRDDFVALTNDYLDFIEFDGASVNILALIL